MRFLYLCCALLIGACATIEPAPVPFAELERIQQEHLFDARGADWVWYIEDEPSTWGWTQEVVHYAWLKEGVLYDTEGYRLEMRNFVTVPFERWCMNAQGIGAEYGYPFNPRVASGFGRSYMIPPRAAISAWLHSRGADELAGLILGDTTDPAAGLCETLAWMRFEAGLRAFMTHDDVRAQREFAICVKLYPEFDSEFGPSARELRRECQRRLAEGKRQPALNEFGQALETLPRDYDSWTEAQQADWLVAGLDECDARQLGQPGGIDLGTNWRAGALFKLGPDALPALRDALENTRPTRCVGFTRDFIAYRDVLRVCDVANSIIRSIHEGELGHASQLQHD